MKAWKIGAIIGRSYILLETFYRGWASPYISVISFVTFFPRMIIASATAVLIAVPFGMILSFLDSSHQLPQIIGVFASSIGALFFYLPMLITPAFIGYLVDLRNSGTPLGTGISRLISRKNFKIGFLYFALLTTIFFIILYIPEPELVRPSEKTDTVSATPVFQIKSKPLILYPRNSIDGPGLSYLNSDDRISAGGGYISDLGGDGIVSMVYPLEDGRVIDVSATKRVSFMKHLTFDFQRYHYYFTINASQHPSPEEMKVIDYLIDRDSIIAEATGYGPYINPPSAKELETINYLKEEGIPPFGTRLKDVNFTDIKPPFDYE
jgi:hypothetical protein